jgi:predicted RNA-binding Zn-ribbon protein involved in translation (DUF1610 family)
VPHTDYPDIPVLACLPCGNAIMQIKTVATSLLKKGMDVTYVCPKCGDEKKQAI